nr:hypothetical protein [Tanacetum cinerariifolium]
CPDLSLDHRFDLDTFSSVRRPKHNGVIWMKKGLSNTSNVDLSSVSHSKLNKDVKRYSRKDLLSCNNSHLGETSRSYVCNDAMNVSCNSRLCDSFDENNLFIFDDESVRISPFSKIPFKKNPHDSMNVRSKSNSKKSLPRTVHRWLPKMQPLAEPVAKWIPRHMTGNRALLTNFVEKFLGTVRFGNKDFVVIAGYGDVGLEVAFRKSTCFVRNEDGVDLLTGDRSSNLYTISLNEVSLNSSTCLLEKDSSSQSWLWHQRLSHLNFAIINNLVKNNLVQGLPKMKFKKDHLCSACEQGKIHQIGIDLPQSLPSHLGKLGLAFLNGILKKEVYVGQPLSFFSKQYPDHVYALDKALYGLKQAPRAWHDVLSQFLIESGFQKVPTPMVEQAKLKLDLVGKPVDHTYYHSMIRSLMYVTSSRPDIMFATCMCARYQANPNEHHVSAVKRIFPYLKGTINLGLWYPKDSVFDLTAYSDVDHAGCHLDRKTESEYVAVSGCCAQVLWMRTQLTDYGFFYDKSNDLL